MASLVCSNSFALQCLDTHGILSVIPFDSYDETKREDGTSTLDQRRSESKFLWLREFTVTPLRNPIPERPAEKPDSAPVIGL